MTHRFVLTLLGLALLAGCSEELGRDPFETVPVTGHVRLGTRPVTSGWVVFMPVDGAVGTMRTAPIGTDGAFSIDGVAVGSNVVGVEGVPMDRTVRRIFDPLGSPVRRVLEAGRPGMLDIDLNEELLRWKAGAVMVER